jgi:cytoskeletal protein CcmA (bactofilin family)
MLKHKMQNTFKSVVQFLKSGMKTGNNNQVAEPSEPVVALKKSRGASMIGSNVQVEGNIVSDQDLIIQGQVRGSITAKANVVTVGIDGQLNADILAKIVKIEGAVIGDIIGEEKVVIAKTGNVVGNIQAPRVNLEEGAKFKGSIEMNPEIVEADKLQHSAISESAPETVDSQQIL